MSALPTFSPFRLVHKTAALLIYSFFRILYSLTFNPGVLRGFLILIKVEFNGVLTPAVGDPVLPHIQRGSSCRTPEVIGGPLLTTYCTILR